jgi:DNA modification methylase
MIPELIDLDDVALDPNNARSHDKGIPELIESLRTFGQVKPIVLWAANVCIAGNGTVVAAREMGLTELYAVRVPTDRDYDRARAFALADNRTAELSEWNLPQLEITRWELEANGWDVERFGFDALRPPPLPLLADPDDVPSTPAIAMTIPGQIYQLGRHRLICGDATDVTSYAALMPGELADALWTDPPYNVNYVGGTDDELTIAGDNQAAAAFDRFLRGFFSSSLAYTKPGGAIYVCHPDSNGHLFRRVMVEEGWLLKQCLIWAKNTFVLSRQDYHWQHEPILYGWKPGAAHTWHGPRTQATLLDDDLWDDGKGRTKKELLELLEEIRRASTIIREDKPARSTEHPTMKPVNLITRTLENNAGVQSIVLDPFAGSGSTLVACELLGADFRGIEIDPKYVDVAVTRWENLTGEKAARLA